MSSLGRTARARRLRFCAAISPKPCRELRRLPRGNRLALATCGGKVSTPPPQRPFPRAQWRENPFSKERPPPSPDKCRLGLIRWGGGKRRLKARPKETTYTRPQP